MTWYEVSLESVPQLQQEDYPQDTRKTYILQAYSLQDATLRGINAYTNETKLVPTLVTAHETGTQVLINPTIEKKPVALSPRAQKILDKKGTNAK